MYLDPNKALAELCRRSFYKFVQEFWSVIIPEDPVWNWHIEYICDELQYLNSFVVAREPKPYDLIINVPPGTTKSTIVTQMYNAWVWTVDPSQRFISSSYSKSLSLSHSVKTRDIVQSPKYKALFDELEMKDDEQSKGDFKNTMSGQRFTTSTGSAVTGVHAHQKIIDDPIDPQQANSEADRLAAEEHLKTLSSRNVDKAMTPTILIMQRLHELDPTGLLLAKNKKIKHICLPATDNGNVKPVELSVMYTNGLLDANRLNTEMLAEARVDLGSYGYAGQFDQKPAPDEGGIWKKDWFEIIDWKQDYSNLKWNFVADTAYTKDESNDPSGYLSYAEHNNDFIIRYAQTEFLEFPELCKALPNFVYSHGYTRRSIVEVEPKASGKSLVQTLRRETKLNVKEGKPPAKDKIARAKDSSPVLEAGRIKLIRGPWNKEYVDQVTTFPNAAHDEYVDCTTMMVGDTRPKRKKLRRRN